MSASQNRIDIQRLQSRAKRASSNRSEGAHTMKLNWVHFHTYILSLLCFLSTLEPTTGFGAMIPHELHLHLPLTVPSLQYLPSTIPTSFDSIEAPSFLTATADANTNVFEIASTLYRQQLRSDPLKTKVLTGIVLAILGDALAQTRAESEYNVNRAVSFALFDGCYRAVQQVTYPPMMKLCSGQFLAGVVGALGLGAISPESLKVFGAVEQTLVSQLVIIPTLYYPVFYAVTGAVQGLTVDETIQRAKETFIPLMKRNLMFWIPVQFVAFEFVEENLQIPILIVCGLIWTIILSISAGAAKSTAEPQPVESVVVQEDGAVALEEMKKVSIPERLQKAQILKKDESNAVEAEFSGRKR